MTITPLNLGAVANDGNGQDLRSGGVVINANFAELDQRTAAAQASADAAVTDAELEAGLGAKVDKVSGKGLSTEDFTTGEKNKLAGLQPAHYRGTFITLAALQAGVAAPIAGDYGDVDAGVGEDVQRYIWDATDSKWVLQGASGGGPDNTDSLPEGTTNLYFTGSRVLGVVLSGLSLLTGTAVVPTDSVLVAVGKLQKQITDLAATVANKAGKGVNSDITRLTAIDATGYGLLRDGLPAAVGATSSAAGTKGQVPAPAQLGSNPKFLADDMTFKEAAGGGGDNIGDIKPWKFSRATIPGGRLPNDGQIVTNGRTLYPEFWALIQPFCVGDATWLAAPYTYRGSFSAGDGSTNFRMPDDNGKHPDGNTIAAMVFRGDGKSSAGTPGLHQADQLQSFKMRTAEAAGAPTGVAGFTSDATTTPGLRTAASTATLYSTHTSTPITDGANGTPRIGSETRPANSTVIWCTTVAKVGANTGTVDVTVLSNTVNSQGTQIAALPISKFFESPQTTWAVSGLLSFNPGFEPKITQVECVVTVATANSAVGDRFDVPLYVNTNYQNAQIVKKTASLVNVRCASSMVRIFSNISGDQFTPSNSQIVLRCWG